jgi:5-methyltetrahydrofolate--homocysteine methyltransferase
MEEVEAFLNRKTILVSRWGYKRGGLPEADYQAILTEEAEAHLRRIEGENRENAMLPPRIAARWLPARREGEGVRVFLPEEEKAVVLSFPRLRPESGGSIVDFVSQQEAWLGFFVATVEDERTARFLENLQREGHYQEYHFWTGFAAEWTEAAAEWAHRAMMGPAAHQQSARYAPGYPSCPDLMLNRLICAWTGADKMGVQALASGMMTPEFTTAALLVPGGRRLP